MERPKGTTKAHDDSLTREDLIELERKLKTAERNKKDLATFQSQFEAALKEIKVKRL